MITGINYLQFDVVNLPPFISPCYVTLMSGKDAKMMDPVDIDATHSFISMENHTLLPLLRPKSASGG